MRSTWVRQVSRLPIGSWLITWLQGRMLIIRVYLKICFYGCSLMCCRREICSCTSLWRMIMRRVWGWCTVGLPWLPNKILSCPCSTITRESRPLNTCWTSRTPIIRYFNSLWLSLIKRMRQIRLSLEIKTMRIWLQQVNSLGTLKTTDSCFKDKCFQKLWFVL